MEEKKTGEGNPQNKPGAAPPGEKGNPDQQEKVGNKPSSDVTNPEGGTKDTQSQDGIGQLMTKSFTS